MIDSHFEAGVIHILLFEFDPHKSGMNHISMELHSKEAQALRNDRPYLKIPARNLDDPRFAAIGRIKNKYGSAVIAYRGKKIRIVSVRRSRKEGIKLFENESFSN
jgi:uncharacterized protein